MYQWKQYSNGRQLDIIELGPGRGTLSSDIARSMAQFNQTRQSLNDFHLHLIEISPFLQSIQHRNLCDNEKYIIDNNNRKSSKTKYGQSIHWYQSIDQLNQSKRQSNRFPIFIANEFFDAFPIHKFIVSKFKFFLSFKSSFNLLFIKMVRKILNNKNGMNF